jgi:methylmalonyl-CoA/ethylmalonyl-CoA epimerase
MISRIDHISIAVKDYEKARHFFQNIFGAISGATDKDNDMKYHWQIFSLGNLSRLELISPTGSGSFLEKFFKKRRYGGLHHITLQTPDINNAKRILQDNDIPFFGYYEYEAFGVLIQIAEFNSDDWLNNSLVFPKNKKWEVRKKEGGCWLTFAHPGGGKVDLELTKTDVKKLISDLEQ